MSELEAELADVRAEAERHLLRAEALEPRRRRTPMPSDGAQARSAPSRAALVGLTEWRSVLKHAVDTLGSEGGWNATVAWCPDEPRGSMRAGAIWMRDPAGLATLETRTWQHLSRTATAPNAELMVSLEAIALQLGATAQLLKLGGRAPVADGRR